MAARLPLVVNAGRAQQLQPADVLYFGNGTPPGGRLTTESGVPVSTTDRASQGTVLYTPYLSDYARLYDGTRVREYSFTERSLSLTGLLTSGKNYDWFLYDSSGTLTLELSAAWTNDTTRADALAWQTGLGWVKSGTPTRFWLGTMRATGTGTTEDSSGVTGTTNVGGKRFLWNAYNQVPLPLKVIDTTASWSYTTATIRQARATAGNKVEWVCGTDAVPLRARVTSSVSSFNNTTALGSVGVGIDSTTAYAAASVNGVAGTAGTNNTVFGMSAEYHSFPGLGYHYAAWLEKGGDTNCTFNGTGSFGTQSGLVAEIMG